MSKLEIIRRIAHRQSVAEIARAMGCNTRNIYQHIRRAMKWLRIPKQLGPLVGLTRWAWSVGLASCFLGLVALHASPGLLRNSLTLVWTDPTGTNQTTAAFSVNVYASTTLAVPLTNWAIFTNIAGTNLSVTIPIQPQQMFFVATYSNLWGESPFSGVASAPPPPTNGTLNIK